MKTYESENQFESMHSDEIAELLISVKKELQKSLLENSAIKMCSSPINLLGDVRYPYTCYSVKDQANACKLTSPEDLPSELKGIYRIDAGLANIYAIESVLLAGVQACIYSMMGKSGQVTVSGMSAMRFNTTRPDTSKSQHNFGKAFDVKLQGKMKSDGNKYDQEACSHLCFYCVEAGATRVFFSDQAVVDAVNKATNKSVCSNVEGHENHVHMDFK